MAHSLWYRTQHQKNITTQHSKIPLLFITVHWAVQWKLAQGGLANVIYLPPNMDNPDHKKYPDKYVHIINIHTIQTQTDCHNFANTLTKVKTGLYASLLASMV